uniref:Uncharacterized protein n=1 Tax=Eucampia antarctica TaxID=49252 RepID=A0A7S2S4V6_9STRA|mmetsp:Transcript_31133/g.29976  ORF Transcript_31133/g.29976 Transcript_31133/m.29976 type:complete len:256 (+) Transcript_31133:57-824(+)|eukprot:CAMPEP_0197831346 /NCGR_PEP_ID=MMETSP1437-20131217/9485_1 /TAXON_ID=49252 ORGANISM="Eucampia antarctica, Strain CCMP1452" /NCGR_SAMPLE_ID=MMETSP1437 /ASSEMBLY_ACC=CAM_ASM_001096 /LENGTH=255 /DNA_ID=CAMNT_0043434221 /DNA_START=36 /DNA_END=803 /DNA_ORIENTATION=+
MTSSEKNCVRSWKWSCILLIGVLLISKSSGYSSNSQPKNSRRSFIVTSAASVAAVLVPNEKDAAWASGGATAGKYTTIPIAKRRYYGRVQQAVHDFLLMGPSIVNKDLKSYDVQHFFDVVGVVLVPAKNRAINGQCTKKDNSCKGQEIRDSRYHDMKASMYLLGNAFRINQQKAPDKLPTVQAAKSFFREMDAMEKDILTGKGDKDKTVNSAVSHYIKALDVLDTYLDLVELPPTDSGHYDKEFNTLVGESARLT